MDLYKLKYYLAYKYYLSLNRKLKDIKLNEIQEEYLVYFAFNSHTSPYDVSFDKKINDFGGESIKLNTTAYTKAKLIVRQLYNLKLIELDTKSEEKNSHNKKFYSLTELAVFYIMKHPIFLKINIRSIIKKFPNLKIFEDLLYHFIKKVTLCSIHFPERILDQISSYIQKQYLKIENFFLHTENKTDWNEKRLILNEGKLQNYLFEKYKHKYKWLETADTEQNFDGTIIKFFNACNTSTYLEVRLRENKILIYLKDGTKIKKKPIIIPNIKKFQSELSFSKEECIDRAFSSYYGSHSFEFISSILPAFRIFNFDTARLFLKDKNFIQSLDKSKKEFDKIYMSIKNPYDYSLDAIIQKDLLGGIYSKKLKRSDNENI